MTPLAKRPIEGRNEDLENNLLVPFTESLIIIAAK